jgi:hypothetical protein
MEELLLIPGSEMQHIPTTLAVLGLTCSILCSSIARRWEAYHQAWTSVEQEGLFKVDSTYFTLHFTPVAEGGECIPWSGLDSGWIVDAFIWHETEVTVSHLIIEEDNWVRVLWKQYTSCSSTFWLGVYDVPSCATSPLMTFITEHCYMRSCDLWLRSTPTSSCHGPVILWSSFVFSDEGATVNIVN